MAVRRSVFNELGGFHSVDLDDLDLCLRLGTDPELRRVMFEPRAVVHHFVPELRVSWHYFWRRCYFINREKVEVFTNFGSTGSMRAETRFVRRALTAQFHTDIRDLGRGQFTALARIGAMVIGILLAGLGNAAGRVRLVVRRRGLARTG